MPVAVFAEQSPRPATSRWGRPHFRRTPAVHAASAMINILDAVPVFRISANCYCCYSKVGSCRVHKTSRRAQIHARVNRPPGSIRGASTTRLGPRCLAWGERFQTRTRRRWPATRRRRPATRRLQTATRRLQTATRRVQTATRRLQTRTRSQAIRNPSPGPINGPATRPACIVSTRRISEMGGLAGVCGPRCRGISPRMSVLRSRQRAIR